MCLLFFVSSSIIQCNVCVFVFICVARWNVQTSCFDRAYVVRLCMCITVPKQIEIPNSRTLVNMCVRMRVFVCVIFVFYSHREHLPHDFRIFTPRRPEKNTQFQDTQEALLGGLSRTTIFEHGRVRATVFAQQMFVMIVAPARVFSHSTRCRSRPPEYVANRTEANSHSLTDTHTRTNSICIIAERPGPVCLGAIIIIM